MQYQLAQVNIAKAKAPLDQPLMQGFVEQLEQINALAEHVELPWSMVVENRTEIDASHFLRQLAAHLGGQTVRQRPG